MTLQETIKSQIKDAMIAKDTVRLTVLRGLTAAFMNEAITKKVDALKDEETIAVIKRTVKQRKDSIEQFTKGGRPELAADEQAELAILEKYLPTMMSKEEIKKIALAKKAELNVTDKAGAGKLMGAIIKETKGMADGADVKAVVDELFT